MQRRRIGLLTGLAGLLWSALLFVAPPAANAGVILQAPTYVGLGNGLVGYWSFDGKDMAGLTAYDRSGQGNNGTTTSGFKRVAGKIGQTVDFQITPNTGISVSPSATINNLPAMSMSAWINPRSRGSGGQGAILVKASSVVAVNGWRIGYTALLNNLSFDVNYDGITLSATTTASPFILGEWQHVVVVWDGSLNSSSVKIYRNASPEPMAPGINGSGNRGDDSAQKLTIGRSGDDNARFDGLIDEVRIYNRALSADEIKRLYKIGGTLKFNVTRKDTITSGLVGHWSFDGQDVAGATAYDRSGQGNNGTIASGPARVAGKIGQALVFPGSDNGVVLITDFGVDGGLAMSASLWAKSQLSSSPVTTFAGQSGVFRFRWEANENMRFAVSTDQGEVLCATSFNYTDASWHHLMGIYDGAEVGVYVDGIKRGSCPHSGAIVTSANTGEIGDSFLGTIDDVRTYNRALTPDEIKRLYNMGGTFKTNASRNDVLTDGLVGLWSFDAKDMAGVTAYDRSGQGNNGTLTNGPARAAGKLGQGLSFDGVDDYVDTNTDLSNFITASEGTFSIWCKPEGAPFTDTTVYNLPPIIGDAGGWMGIHRGINSGSDRLWIYNFDGNIDQVGVTYNVDEWIHLAWVHAGGVLYAYKNGELAASTASGNTSQLNRIVKIASGYDVPNKFFDGLIDDVRIYNRALSVDEVKRLYNMGR